MRVLIKEEKEYQEREGLNKGNRVDILEQMSLGKLGGALEEGRDLALPLRQKEKGSEVLLRTGISIVQTYLNFGCADYLGIIVERLWVSVSS